MRERLDAEGAEPAVELVRIARVAEAEGDLNLAADCWGKLAAFAYPKPRPVEVNPDSLVALEGRLHRARLEAVAELARDDPALVTLADRLARARERHEHFIVVAADVPRSPDGPVIDAEPAPAPKPTTKPASEPDFSADSDGAEEATPPPPPPPPPPPAPPRPVLPWPDAPATAEQDYDPWNFD